MVPWDGRIPADEEKPGDESADRISLADGTARRNQRDGGIDAMGAAGEQAQAGGGLVDDLGLRQDAPADRDDRIGRNDVAAFQIGARLHAEGLRDRLHDLGGVGSGIAPGILVKIIGTSTCDMVVAKNTTAVADVPGICGIVDFSQPPEIQTVSVLSDSVK